MSLKPLVTAQATVLQHRDAQVAVLPVPHILSSGAGSASNTA
jgi:hypothetical protein